MRLPIVFFFCIKSKVETVLVWHCTIEFEIIVFPQSLRTDQCDKDMILFIAAILVSDSRYLSIRLCLAPDVDFPRNVRAAFSSLSSREFGLVHVS